MKRREVITLLGGAAAWPIAARAQQLLGTRRIGVLIGVADDIEGQARLGALQGLQALGWTEGHNIQMVTRFAPNEAERQTYSAELVRLAPDVILANTSQVVQALLRETKTIPIVFAQLPDPVSFGLVSNLARPGGNVTGFTSFELAMGGKWLDLLKEIAPTVARTLVIGGESRGSALPQYLSAITAAAAQHRVQLTSAGLSNATQIEPTIDQFARETNGGLILVPDPIATVQLELFISLAARYRLPAIYPYRYFVTRGGLMSYGIDNLDLFRRAASYVDRVLKGEKPGDLPVQGPTKYELLVNLKTANALGVDVPLHLQQLADEVVE